MITSGTLLSLKRRGPVGTHAFIVDLYVQDPLVPYLSADILRDYTLDFMDRVESTLRDLKEYLTEAIGDKDCCKELLDATVEDYDEIGRAYEVELATLRAELEQRSLPPLAMEAECIHLRS